MLRRNIASIWRRVWSFMICAAFAVVVVNAVWLFWGRWCSLRIDRIHTVRIAPFPSSPFGWNGTYLQFGSSVDGISGVLNWNGPEPPIGSQILDLDGPAPAYTPAARFTASADGRLVATAGGRRFVFGYRAGTLPDGNEQIPAFAAEPGDTTSMTVERSWLSWPTPFEMNFMTGHTSSWRRHLYYRLSWTKPSGARLQMTWRLVQGYDRENGWTSPGPGDAVTGLISVDIQPEPASAAKP